MPRQTHCAQPTTHQDVDLQGHNSTTIFGRSSTMSRIRMIFASVGITFLFALSVARAQSMKLLTPEVGWALMGPGLIWTADAGQHWSKITPPLSPGEYIASVFFLDTSTGWALLSKPPSQGEEQPHFQLAATSDSGANWSVTPMSIPSPNRGITLAGSGVLDFVDPLHGWVNLDVVSS